MFMTSMHSMFVRLNGSLNSTVRYYYGIKEILKVYNAQYNICYPCMKGLSIVAYSISLFVNTV